MPFDQQETEDLINSIDNADYSKGEEISLRGAIETILEIHESIYIDEEIPRAEIVVIGSGEITPAEEKPCPFFSQILKQRKVGVNFISASSFDVDEIECLVEPNSVEIYSPLDILNDKPSFYTDLCIPEECSNFIFQALRKNRYRHDRWSRQRTGHNRF